MKLKKLLLMFPTVSAATVPVTSLVACDWPWSKPKFEGQILTDLGINKDNKADLSLELVSKNQLENVEFLGDIVKLSKEITAADLLTSGKNNEAKSDVAKKYIEKVLKQKVSREELAPFKLRIKANSKLDTIMSIKDNDGAIESKDGKLEVEWVKIKEAIDIKSLTTSLKYNQIVEAILGNTKVKFKDLTGVVITTSNASDLINEKKVTLVSSSVRVQKLNKFLALFDKSIKDLSIKVTSPADTSNLGVVTFEVKLGNVPAASITTIKQ